MRTGRNADLFPSASMMTTPNDSLSGRTLSWRRLYLQPLFETTSEMISSIAELEIHDQRQAIRTKGNSTRQYQISSSIDEIISHTHIAISHSFHLIPPSRHLFAILFSRPQSTGGTKIYGLSINSS